MAEPPYESFLEDELSEQMLQETEEHVTAAPPKMVCIEHWRRRSHSLNQSLTKPVTH